MLLSNPPPKTTSVTFDPRISETTLKKAKSQAANVEDIIIFIQSLNYRPLKTDSEGSVLYTLCSLSGGDMSFTLKAEELQMIEKST